VVQEAKVHKMMCSSDFEKARPKVIGINEENLSLKEQLEKAREERREAKPQREREEEEEEEKKKKNQHGARENEDGEEIFTASDRALLLSDDLGLSHEQEASRRSSHHPLEEASEQDRRFLHPSHEAYPEGSCSRHLAQAAGGGA